MSSRRGWREDVPENLPKYVSITGKSLDLDLDKSFLGKCRHVDEFQTLNRLGEGTYGVVKRAIDRKVAKGDKHSIVALKQVHIQDLDRTNGIPITTLREISILRSLKNDNVVRVLDVAVGDELTDVYMVMEYAEQDLANLLDYARVNYSQSEVKCLAKQLFEGLEYLHSRDIIHRDIKASNLLLTAKGILKIADFGLAREYSARPLTPKVVTVWYRSPELLFGESRYSPAIDIWSAGMVFGEIIKQMPLCPGDNEIDQINKIFGLLGVPSERIWPSMRNLPGYHDVRQRVSFTGSQTNTLEIKFLGITSSATVGLINDCLTYDPNKRITATQALRHQYFRESPAPKEPSLMPTFPEARNNSSNIDGANDTIAVHGKRAGAYVDSMGGSNSGYVFDFDGQFGPVKKRYRQG